MTYWNNEGKYQLEYEEVYRLVPTLGKCENEDIELLRLVSNAYYDVYNNGGCNSNRFKYLYDELIRIDWFDKLYMSVSDWSKLLEFLRLAAIDDDSHYDENDEWVLSDRDLYFVDFIDLSDDNKLFLTLLEELADTVVLYVYKVVNNND